MSITISKNALSRVVDTFQIQKDDTQVRSIAKFAGGTALKTAVMSLAGFEYVTASMGSFLPIRSAIGLTEYANEAAETFSKAVSSINRPFAPTTRVVSKWCGLKKETITEEGRTVTSYINDTKAAASKNKSLIATGVILAAAAITLYYFGPSIFSTAAGTQQPLPINLPQNMPVFGPENMPVFGPENMPVFGPQNMPEFGPENIAKVSSSLTNPFLEMSPAGDVCPLFNNETIEPGITRSFPLEANLTVSQNTTLAQLSDRDVFTLKPAFSEIPAFTISQGNQLFDGTRTDFHIESPNFEQAKPSAIENAISWFQQKASQTAVQVATKLPVSSIVASGIAARHPEHYRFAFGLGVAGTIFETLAIRLYNIGSEAVAMGEKLKSCGQYANFEWINRIKQLEIKTFAFASPAVLFGMNLISDAMAGRNIRNQFNRKNLVFYGTLAALSLTNPFYGKMVGLTTKAFDSSGHMMMKASVAPAMGAALSQTAANHPIASGALASAYLISDGIFLKNTAQFCHTAYESLAGLGWGAGILAISTLASRILG